MVFIFSIRQGLYFFHNYCIGELINLKKENDIQNPDLVKQIDEVISSLGRWKAGKLNDTEVDAVVMLSFKIKMEKIVIPNKHSITFNLILHYYWKVSKA